MPTEIKYKRGKSESMKKLPENRYDAALGAMLGACVGDAAGATLEFMYRPPTTAEVDHALTLPGGGMLGVAPGQITDDCELGICLARALAQSPSFDLERIALSYVNWIGSNPFDIGTTTINGLGVGSRREWDEVINEGGYAVAMTRSASQRSMDSKSNGSLMRASPLGIWGAGQPAESLALYAQKESSLSHPNESCWQAVACYVIAIAHLIEHLGDREGAYIQAQQWANRNANREVRSWLEDAEANRAIAYSPQIGFVRIGFTHAFRHLLLGTEYVTALHETLVGGGDTDTNACIVGGLLGAAEGANSIPDMMRQAVLTCDTGKGQPRPTFLHPKQVPLLVKEMLTITT